jgi:Domain of unknown function (DUF5916)/Carbohydrate family 9 binding domain-like
MRALRNLWILLLIAPLVVHAQGDQMKVKAIHVSEQIIVDGKLTEAAWQGAGFTSFTQKEPSQGQPPTQQTEVWVAYDDAALYVAARLYDTAPDSIMQLLGRRDVFTTADWFNVYLDPYHDRRTGFYFSLSAAGTKRDGTLYNDDWDDNSWDGVWTGNAVVDDKGWTLEMRIPFSQLRFHEKSSYVWGINFEREIGRNNESDCAVYTPRNGSGFVSRFPDLVNINSITPAQQIELLPYVNTRAEYTQHQQGDPFNDGSKYLPGVGADLKVGLSSNLTLDGTINPDFGQVEVDPAVVNLSDVETYFQEKRPFFVEGANIFEFGYGGSNNFWGFNWGSPTIFYSRRIGRDPQGSLPSAYDYADVPLGTHILGAGKVTGRVFDDWKIGMVHAVTNREFASLQTAGQRSKAEIEPLTYYGVARAQRDYNDGKQGLGFIATYTDRFFQDQSLRDILNSNSLVAGIDGWTFLDDDKTYVITGWGSMSNVQGTATRMIAWQQSSTHYFQRPDAKHFRLDSSATSITGFAGRIMLNKQKGNFILNAALGTIDPRYDSNDLGFMWRTNLINGHVVAGYSWKEPTPYYRTLRLQFATFGNLDYDGNKVWHGYFHNGNVTFPNYWSTYWVVAYNPTTVDNRRTRGGPLMIQLPGREFDGGIYSDDRKSVVVGIDAYSYLRTNEPSWGVSSNVEWKPAPNISFQVGPSFSRDRSQAQYVTTVADPTAVATYGNRYVFAVLDQVTVSANIRLNWTFTPQLSLQLFMQPLISTGDYHDFKELRTPKTFNFLQYGRGGSTVTKTLDGSTVTDYTFDPDGTGPATSFDVSNPDFNFTSIRANAVLRWEYKPGSTLYVVWTRSSSGSITDGSFRFGPSFDRMIEANTDNILMVKFSYWFSF